MKKEIIVCIIVLILILVGDIITQNYSKNSAKEISEELGDIKINIENDFEADVVIKKMENVEDNWDNTYNKLAYYIEHEELEKVKTGIISAKSYVKLEEISEAVNEIDRTMYVLEHIVEKYKVNLKNIF